MERSSSAAGGIPPSDMALAFAVASLQAPKPATTDDASLPFSSLQQHPVMSDHAVAAAAASVLAMGLVPSSFPRQQQPRESAPPAMHSSMTPLVVATGTSHQSPSSPTDSSSSSHAYTTHPERLAQTRERNKEHARKTRLRKKAHLQDLQGQVQTLQARHGQLQQQIQDCSIASILLGLSGSSNPKTSAIADDDTPSSTAATVVQQLLTQGRRRSPQSEQQQQEPLKLHMPGGKVLEIGTGHSNIHWKTGVYRDADGKQQKLTPQQLQLLRRERNRRHAKLTRDRKKCFVALLQQTIYDLQADIAHCEHVLAQVGGTTETVTATSTKTSSVTKISQPPSLVSPELSPSKGGLLDSENGNIDRDKSVVQPTTSNMTFTTTLTPSNSTGFRLDEH